jgi:RNA polymerase sigma-70 factor (ECF subfamily)
MDSPDRLTLIRDAIAGDAAALEAVVRIYAERLRWLVRLRLDPAVRARVSADDVVQETMIVASRCIDRLVIDEESAFWSWLCRIAEDRIIDVRRRHLGTAKRDVRRERGEVARETNDPRRPVSSPSGRSRRREGRAALESALDELPESFREVIVLRIVEGLPVDETAGIMGRTPAAVRVLLCRAVTRLGEVLAAREGSGFAQGAS